MSRLRYGFAACACALLILPTAASARPGSRTFNQTFPIASGLCTNIAAGRGPAKLRADASQIAGLCGSLRTSYLNAQNTYFATVTPLKTQATALVTATRQACATRPSAICKSTRQTNRPILRGLRAQVRVAGVTYRSTIETARKVFWSQIHTLRGAATLKPDTGTPLTPTVTLPTSL